MSLVIAAIASFFGSFVVVPLLLKILHGMGFYTIIGERTCMVYMLFGKVVGTIDEPGLHFLWLELGPKALLVPWIGARHKVDLRLDQVYLRSQAVNSEEGAPMGIGIWYEMYVSDPVDFLFKNVDPRGSLAANVSSAAIRSLSNMELEDMLIDRHAMSRTVRGEVTPLSHKWGYALGSVYIRKVHFRDLGMTQQIEEKVVNRLRQVTSAILQDGANQVSVITSAAERKAAVEFARADAMRPQIVGDALRKIAEDQEVEEALFEILEVQKILEGEADLVLIPPGSDRPMLNDILATQPGG